MTGVGGRPELIIKGSMDGSIWKEYIFPYKPQALDAAPRFNIPHQPRLDWQMWFAALSNINNSYWFFTMLNRLFAGSQSVFTLFQEVPYERPRFIKVEMYLYNFTSGGEEWWSRRYVRDWLPAISTEKQLVEQWKKLGFPDPKLAKKRDLHVLHFVPLLEIATAAILIKVGVSIFQIYRREEKIKRNF